MAAALACPRLRPVRPRLLLLVLALGGAAVLGQNTTEPNATGANVTAVEEEAGVGDAVGGMGQAMPMEDEVGVADAAGGTAQATPVEEEVGVADPAGSTAQATPVEEQVGVGGAAGGTGQVTPAPEVVSVGDAAVAKLQVAQSEALPKMLEALQCAEQLGLSTTVGGEEAKVLTRAAADLALLSEVTAVAGSTMMGGSTDFEQAVVATQTIDVGRINGAFAAAAAAGVPEDEQALARELLQGEMMQRLAHAAAAIATNRSAAAVEELAHAIFVGRGFGLVEAELAPAVQAYERQLQGPFTDKDLGFLELLVGSASHARVRVPAEAAGWASAYTAVRELAAQSGNDTMLLRRFLVALRRARELGLPRAVEVADVEAKVQSCAALNLDEVLAKSSNPNAQFFAALTPALADAQEAGLSNETLAAAWGRAQTLARAEMQRALAGDRDDVAGIIQALDVAQLAKVPEVAEARAALVAEVSARLSAAKAAAGGNFSTQAIEELAHAIYAAHKLGDNQTELAMARAVYEGQLGGPFTEAEMGYLERAAALAGEARVKVPPQIAELVAASTSVREANALSDTEPQNFPRFLAALRLARSAGLPSPAAVAVLVGKAQTCAAARLKELTASRETDAEHVGTLVAAMGQAQEAGAGGANTSHPALTAALAAATAKARALAAGELHKALAGDENDAVRLNLAFDSAALAGVAAAAASRANLTAQLQARLTAAKAGAEAGRATEALQELANAIFVGHKMGLEQEELASARQVYESLLEGAMAEANVTYAERAVELAGIARVKVPPKLSEWVVINDKLRQAISASAAAGVPRTDELAVAEAMAQELAAASLVEASSHLTASVVQEAVDSAVLAGVPEADLMAGRAILNAQSARRLAARRA